MQAVIDIGSNSVRLMLSKEGKTLSKEGKTTRLGKELLKNGYLLEASIVATVDAIIYFTQKAKSLGANEIYVFATEAVRKATNRQLLIDKIYDATNIKIDVITGEKEALLGVLGALNNNDGAIIDIGGASTEISIQQNGEIIYSHSMPLGSVLLKELSLGSKLNARQIVVEKIKEYGSIPKTKNYYAIGGTATTIASMMQSLEPYDPTKVQGYLITKNSVESWCTKLFLLTNIERENIKGLQKERADVIPYGVVILEEIMKMLNIEKVIVSENDNLEGYLQLKKGKYE